MFDRLIVFLTAVALLGYVCATAVYPEVRTDLAKFLLDGTKYEIKEQLCWTEYRDVGEERVLVDKQTGRVVKTLSLCVEIPEDEY